jgi:hypothetical protein
MRLYNPENFRRLIRHCCQYCGRVFFADKQGGRPRLFCDKTCKDGEFRRLRYLTLKNVESPPKSEVNSEASKVDSGDRPSVLTGLHDPPINILGGYKFPNAPTWSKFQPGVSPLAETAPVVPSDWRPCLPSDWETLLDLPIPAFLQRRPS